MGVVRVYTLERGTGTLLWNASEHNWATFPSHGPLCADAEYSALLATRVPNLEVAQKWHKAKQAVAKSADNSSDSNTMSSFYWCNIAKELHSKLKKVKGDLQGTNWQVREVGARWKGVESSVKGVMLAKISLAKTLYTYYSA